MKKTVVLLCVLGLIAFSYGLAPAADKDVVVTNTSANPVPIAGNVAITGTPNVNVTNTPSVNVANTASNPVQVYGNVEVVNLRTRVSSKKSLDCGALVGCGTLLDISVPAGKRLVIEQFSCWAALHQGEAIGCTIDSNLIEEGDNFFRTCTSIMTPITPSNGSLGAGQQVRCYSDREPVVYLVKFGFSELRTVTVDFSIFGYFEDAQ